MIKKIKSEKFLFLKNTSNFVLAEIISKGIMFLSLPIYTRLFLPSDFGVFAIFVTIVDLGSIILMLNFKGAVSRFYYENKDEFPEFLASILIFLLGINIILIPALIHYGNVISSWFEVSIEIYTFGILFSILKIILIIYNFYLVASKQSKEYLRVNLIQSFFQNVIAIALLVSIPSLTFWSRIYGMIAILVILDIYILYQFFKISKLNFSYKYVKYALLFGIPLIPGSMSSFVLNMFDRIIINQLNGFKDAGLYSFAYSIGLLMSLVIHSMNKAWGPMFYEKIKNKNNNNITDMAVFFTKLICGIELIFIFFVKYLLYFIADEKYHGSLNVIKLVAIGYLFNLLYIYYVGYIEYLKKTWVISLCIVLSGIVNTFLNYRFIPYYGYEIAAVTTIFSYFVLFLSVYLYLKIFQKNMIIIPIIKFVPALLLFSVILVLNEVFMIYNSNELYIILFKIFSVCIFCLISFRKKINQLRGRA